MIPDHPLAKDHHTKTSIKVRAYNIQELSDLYQVNKKTLRRWIMPFRNDLGERNGRYYNVLQVQMIFMKLGVPFMVMERG